MLIASTFLPIFFFTGPGPTEISTLSLHDALPILLLREPLRDDVQSRLRLFHGVARLEPAQQRQAALFPVRVGSGDGLFSQRSEEHTSELQSRRDLVCRLLLEKKKKKPQQSLSLHN